MLDACVVTGLHLIEFVALGDETNLISVLNPNLHGNSQQMRPDHAVRKVSINQDCVKLKAT